MAQPIRKKGLVWLLGKLAVLVAALTGCMETRIPDPNVTYIAFGDSATAGPTDRDYPVTLQQELDVPPDAIANEGVGGESTAEGDERLAALLADGLYPNARVLLYWEGGNDVIDFIGNVDPFLLSSPRASDYPYADELDALLGNVQTDIERAIRAGQEAGLQVFVATYFSLRTSIGECKPLPLNLILPFQAERANEYVAMLNDVIRMAAFREGAVLVDVATVSSMLTADGDNYHDCNHLSEAGNAIVANVFRDAILINQY